MDGKFNRRKKAAFSDFSGVDGTFKRLMHDRFAF